jgi:hypothetical protein
MKVNSEHLYKYINDLATDEKVKFKVYYDDIYVTQIYWNGESFEWDTGTFTSEAFFNPLYDFEVIEEDKKKIEQFTDGEMKVYHDMSAPIDDLAYKVSLIIDKINEIIDKLEEK